MIWLVSLYVLGFVGYLLGVEKNVVKAALWPFQLMFAISILIAFFLLAVLNSIRGFK